MAGDEAVLIYRAPMWSRDDDVDPRLGPERALRVGVCGVGGRLSRVPGSLDEAVAAVAEKHDRRMAERLRRFAEVPDGAQVWTRLDGLFHRGTLRGPWRYDGDVEAVEDDLVHVRSTTWHGPEDPPSAMLAAFARGGRNFQRVRGA